MRKIKVLADKPALIEQSLSLILERVHSACQERGMCTIALAGGSTPKPLYEAIATQDLPWEKIHVFWGDERYVPAENSDSNQRMARQAWLDKVNIPVSNIHPMPTEGGDPAADAKTHSQHLQEFFQLSPGEFPSFDIILLGTGDDAHTASLFPHTEALKVKDSLVTVGNKSGEPRLTFSVPLINQARCVIFLVAGENKQTALAHIFASEADDSAYPARLIQPEGELWWLLDKAAGAELKPN
ncbi:MAG: 6-phosphogluconolactonase [Spirulinaceae cyanobacterium]